MDNEIYCMGVKSVDSVSTPLLAMKCLPFALENHFVTDDFKSDLARNGYEFAFVYGIDQEIPDSHCGRYFELRKKIEGKREGEPQDSSVDTYNRTIYRGWIGVDYNGSCAKDISQPVRERETYWDSPTFTIEISKDFPDAKLLQENSWGWKCIELGDTDRENWGVVFGTAKKELLNLISNASAMR